MKIRNMQSPNGNDVPNQFIIEEEGRGALGNFTKRETFQSYDAIIAIVTRWDNYKDEVTLDETYWDHSRTTRKYRNIFLGETKAETERKISAGIYRLENLNK